MNVTDALGRTSEYPAPAGVILADQNGMMPGVLFFSFFCVYVFALFLFFVGEGGDRKSFPTPGKLLAVFLPHALSAQNRQLLGSTGGMPGSKSSTGYLVSPCASKGYKYVHVKRELSNLFGCRGGFA